MAIAESNIVHHYVFTRYEADEGVWVDLTIGFDLLPSGLTVEDIRDTVESALVGMLSNPGVEPAMVVAHYRTLNGTESLPNLT